MTGRQLRAARALLGWSAERLAETSKIGLTTIRRAEGEDGTVRMTAANVNTIRRTFEDVGVEFISENGGGAGVRMKTPQSSTKDSAEA